MGSPWPTSSASRPWCPSGATERSQLASVKAVTPGYPLRGTLRVADQPFGRGRRTDALPAPGEVWLDSRLFPALGLRVGDTVAVGYAEFTASAVLASEPDRGGGFLGFAPRLLMRAEDIPATRVIQPGSRIRYRLQLAGDDDALRSFHDAIRDELRPGYRWRDVRSANARIDSALTRAESFLLLGGLLTVLLAGVAVALSARRYARRHYDHVAVLKTLGATPAEVQWGYTLVLLIIAVAGALVGLLLGALAHFGIIAALHARSCLSRCLGRGRGRSRWVFSPVSSARWRSACRRFWGCAAFRPCASSAGTWRPGQRPP